MGKTIVFDFDGVIHSYKSGWKGAEVIPDPPVPGIKHAIKKLRRNGYEVAVVSSRCATNAGMEAIIRYLSDNEIVVDKVCKEKPPAVVYVDDRAVCFDGNVDKMIYEIINFENWIERKMDRLEAQLKAEEYRKKMQGNIYMHFKGNLYIVIDIGVHSETAEINVIYRQVGDDTKRIWIRPVEMFLSPVDKEKYPDVVQEERFKLVT